MWNTTEFYVETSRWTTSPVPHNIRHHHHQAVTLTHFTWLCQNKAASRALKGAKNYYKCGYVGRCSCADGECVCFICIHVRPLLTLHPDVKIGDCLPDDFLFDSDAQALRITSQHFFMITVQRLKLFILPNNHFYFDEQRKKESLFCELVFLDNSINK